MRVILVGTNHQTALAVRGWRSRRRVGSGLQLREGGEIEERRSATCNRTEVCAGAGQWRRSCASSARGVRRADPASTRAMTKTQSDTSIAWPPVESVLGEAQILGQVKAAWCAALDAGAVGPVLDPSFAAPSQQASACAQAGRHAPSPWSCRRSWPGGPSASWKASAMVSARARWQGGRASPRGRGRRLAHRHNRTLERAQGLAAGWARGVRVRV